MPAQSGPFPFLAIRRYNAYMAEPLPLHTITLGGRPIYDIPGSVATNQFYMHSGASRVGMGWFIMQRSDFDALMAQIDTTGEPTQQVFLLVMTCAEEQGGGFTIQVVIAGCEPFSTSTGTPQNQGNQATDFMRVK